MKRITLTVVAVLLAVPGAALAKAGLEFDTPPQDAKVGQKQHFTIVVMSEPRDPNRRPHPVAGVHPLVTFRSQSSGRVIRVRAERTDIGGLAYASVAFPDRGPWSSALHAGRIGVPASQSEPFYVGTPVRVFPPPARHPAPAPGGGGFPWVWVLSIAAVLAALAVLAARAGMLPARLRTLFGGGA